MVIPRPVGDAADDSFFSVPPSPLGRCPSTPVGDERADTVRKGGAEAARGARPARVTWPGPHGRRGRPCRSPKRHSRRGHPYRGKPRTRRRRAERRGRSRPRCPHCSSRVVGATRTARTPVPIAEAPTPAWPRLPWQAPGMTASLL